MRMLLWGLVLSAGQLAGYEVWIGTHLSTSETATDLASWSQTASQVEGFNVNLAPHDTDPVTNNEFRTILGQFTNAKNAMREFARSQATRDPDMTDELAFPSIASRLEILINSQNTYNFDLSIIMFYDERGTFQGTEYLYQWSEIEIQYLRDWLDENGHEDIELMWNVRNNSVRNQELAAHPLVDSVEIEASTTALLDNTNNQMTFFNWFWNNPATANKRIAMQIPRNLPGDSKDQFQGTRRVAKLIGDSIGYGEDGIRSDRLVFLPVTYNDNFNFIPETVSGGTAYTNSLTSIALSLIEQRSLFEGRSRVPTDADADSKTRLFAPTVGTIGDQTVAFETSTGALSFSVSDDVTAAGALTISKSSSNPTLVPLGNIVLGGSGGNRTVTVTPAAGQSGSAEIELWVSDGTLASPIIFEVTVLPSGLAPGTIYSLNDDCSITENPSIEKLSSETVDVGARGASPWVERCTVYVFQLPDLGAVTNPFQEASFTYHVVDKSGGLRGHDLYGLGRRASPTVLTGDFYSQSATADPTDATRIQQTIMNDSTPLGLVSTTAGGSANLVSYLNSQYAGGAGIGEYVFLRINTRDAKTELNYATLTMSEGGVVSPQDTRPRISYQATSPAPTISAIPDQSVVVNSGPITIPFTIGDAGHPVDSLTLSGTSSNSALIPNSGMSFGGSGANRTVTLTPLTGVLGTTEITIEVSNGTFSGETSFVVVVEGLREVVAGWDDWNSNTAPGATVTGSGIVATATASAATGSWNTADDGSSGRGSSGDGTWGSFDGGGVAASAVVTGPGANMTAANGVTDAEMTFTITNNGSADWDLEGFHMDVIAFRPNAPRAYELRVLSGGVTNGVVFTSADDAINQLGGTLSGGNDDHDEIDLDLTGLADATLEPGETVVLQLAFSSGAGSGGGHHLFVDNVAVSGVTDPMTALQSWRMAHFGTTENTGMAADGFDANGDGEVNLLEFATGQDPHSGSFVMTSVGPVGGGFEFRYTRSQSAVGDGVVFTVEWSDSLEAGSWSSAGVSEMTDPENPGGGELENRVVTLPQGSSRRFVRLRVSSQ
ncbi:MAG: hypothetical protein ACSHYF_09720 [Verrucomicrobiaceae bacterium]